MEYGGFLPLELNKGEEFYNEEKYKLIRFNSVKASIDFVVKKVSPKRVLLPLYYCPSTIDAIKKMAAVEFYHIDTRLCACIDFNDADCADNVIVLVDYFGTRYREICDFAKQIKNATIIMDCAHNFFAPPVMQRSVYTVNSAKKFFGIPDGSYLISNEIDEGDIEKYSNNYSYSGEYNQFLLKSYEQGTNAAYIEKKVSDERIALHYDGMSILAKGLLMNVDYENVKRQRECNFRILHNMLCAYNSFAFKEAEPYASYHYPLMFEMGKSESAIKIKRSLISERIYIPTLWTGEDLQKKGYAYEQSFADRIILLPMDQRYDAEDMKYIAERVLGYIDEYS